ncbi:hypothetical protein DDT91_11960 [Algoriphagus sp. AK58]|nr:hypothetical protein [Algoriphagus sp. AK58]
MANLLSLISVLACMLLIVLGFNRGFDISDEGLYVLLTVPSQANESGIINYDLFFKLFFQLTGYSFSIVELRLMRLASYFLAAWALTQFLKNQIQGSYSKPQVFLLSVLGLFSGYAFLPPTLSYNSLTVVLGSFWMYSAFSSFTILRKTLLLGLILGVLMYVKFTVALILFPVSALLLLDQRRRNLASVLLLIVPFLLMEILFWMFLGEFAFERLLRAIPLHSARPDYDLTNILKSPSLGLGLLAIGMIPAALLAKVRNQPPAIFYAVLVFGLATIIWLTLFTHITDEWNHVVMISTACLLAYSVTESWSYRSISRQDVLLFVFPFILHFGSNVYWLRIGIHYWVFWLILIFIRTDLFSKRAIYLVPFLTVLLVFNGIWWHPFGQDQALWSPKRSLNLSNQAPLLLDPDLVELVSEIRNFAIEKNITEVSTAYRIPGLAYLSGLSVPHTPMVWDRYQLENQPPPPPQVLICQPLQPLPDGWQFSHSKKLGTVQENPIFLLWN